MLIAARSSQDFACCARDCKRSIRNTLALYLIWLRRLERDFAGGSADLGLEPSFFGCFDRRRRFKGTRRFGRTGLLAAV
jgi:hypothetical protein